MLVSAMSTTDGRLSDEEIASMEDAVQSVYDDDRDGVAGGVRA